MKRKYLVILSLILCISLGLSSVSAALVASDSVDNDNIIDIDDNTAKVNKVNSVKTDSLKTYVKLDQNKIPATKPSTVIANVYTTFNGVHTLVKVGTISLYINGEKQQTIDLSKCDGIAKFSIPALHENKDCKIVYEGGRDKDSEFDFTFLSSSKALIVGKDSDALATIIKVVPTTISGYAGDVVKFSAKVVFDFNDVESIATEGNVYLLKDGKTLQIADLTRSNNPSFSFKLEKGHKYSLMYDGAEDVGEMDLDLSGSSKDLNVKVLEKSTNKTTNKTINQTNNQTNNQLNNQNANPIDNSVNMESSGYLVGILVIAIIVIVCALVYLRKDK